MIKISNKLAAEYVRTTSEFKGSNTWGQMEHGSYVVYSYGYHYPMFVFKNGKWYENSDKYSVTTSKHKSILRPDFTWDIIKLTTKELRELIYN